MEIKRVRELREEKELTQSEVAKILGIAQGTYAMNEAGYDTITLINLIKLCDYYNISVDYMFSLTNQKNYNSSTPSFNKETLKSRLKECRKENKYTQVKIGELLNVDHSVWCRYEKGKTIISTTFLYTICHKFNISADYILGKTNETKYLK